MHAYWTVTCNLLCLRAQNLLAPRYCVLTNATTTGGSRSVNITASAGSSGTSSGGVGELVTSGRRKRHPRSSVRPNGTYAIAVTSSMHDITVRTQDLVLKRIAKHAQARPCKRHHRACRVHLCYPSRRHLLPCWPLLYATLRSCPGSSVKVWLDSPMGFGITTAISLTVLALSIWFFCTCYR